MDVAVAGVTGRAHEGTVLRRDEAHRPQVLRDRSPRYDHVDDVVRAERLHDPERLLPRLEQQRAGARRQHEHVDRTELAGQLRQRGGVFLEASFVVFFEHHDQVGARRFLDLGRDAEVEPDVRGERGEATAVDVLQDEWIHTAAHDLRHAGRDVVDRRERNEHRRAELRPRVDLQHGLGDDRERSLGTDDELREVVTGRGLDELPARPDDVAVGEDGLEPEHLIARDAVLHRAHAARVRRDVAAERRAVLARIHRIHETQRRERGVELIEADAGLNDRDVVLGVDLENRVHALEREDNSIRRAGCTRPTIPCRHRAR